MNAVFIEFFPPVKRFFKAVHLNQGRIGCIGRTGCIGIGHGNIFCKGGIEKIIPGGRGVYALFLQELGIADKPDGAGIKPRPRPVFGVQGACQFEICLGFVGGQQSF